MRFQDELTQWYQLHKRDLPWRRSKDPYVIWLSEVILQQTRVEQGTPYFQRFIEQYPTVGHLADATESQVLNLWQGLGYYSRGRNMHFTAQQVVRELDGKFPRDHTTLIRLKGVGAYTAAAIASIAGGEVHAVVDGNVYRVLSRFFGLDAPIDTTPGKKVFQALADELIVDTDPGTYNQAIMEFGALVCKPARPLCDICVLRTGCFARHHGKVQSLPVKSRKIAKRNRFLSYFMLETAQSICMYNRPAGDIWQGLSDLPGVETEEPVDFPQLRELARKKFGDGLKITSLVSEKKHLLTHQKLHISFYRASGSIHSGMENGYHWIPLARLDSIPMPIVIHNFIKETIQE